MPYDSPGGEDHARRITELHMLEDSLWHGALLKCLQDSGMSAEMQARAALIVGEEMGKAHEKIRAMHTEWSARLGGASKEKITDTIGNLWDYTSERLGDARMPTDVIDAIAPIFQNEVQHRMGLSVKTTAPAGRSGR